MTEPNTTESDSRHSRLDELSISELAIGINSEDRTVPEAISAAIPAIVQLTEAVVNRFRLGGRLFYLGAGTSGRLGIVDASECPPTYGVPQDMVIGIIAGGDGAIRKAVEFAEDDTEQGWKDLLQHHVGPNDFVVGISASGKTPYVLGALKQAKANGLATGCIVCNSGSAIAAAADFPVEVVTGPEFVTGSTRMKAGTAQKLVLNMITTISMIQLGKVSGNKMVNMQLSNNKLIDRGTRMVMEQTALSYGEAKELLLSAGSVRLALEKFRNK